MSTSPDVSTLVPADRERWAELWRGYLTFYKTERPDAVYTSTWSRTLDPQGPIRALGVRDDAGRLAGITHYFYHPHAWSIDDACYLQDLFVDAAHRGRGYARALIEGVAADARQHNALRVYWHTHETNATARRLYERVAVNTGFVRYDIEL